MEVNSLRSHELSYELLCRGIQDTGDVNQKRRLLRGLLSQERKGITVQRVISGCDFEEDLAGATETVNGLTELISTFSGDRNESVYARLVSRLFHVTQRISKFKAETEEQRNQKFALHNSVLSLEGEMEEKLESFSECSRTLSNVPENVSLTVSRTKSLPPHKWNIQFSGSGPCESINAFLEKIELLCGARQVSKEELFSSACDLFTGHAWTWYVNNRGKVKNWDELVDKLKEDFLPYHYEQDLLREIDQRTQGQQERVTFFISAMENLFHRLKKKPDEQDIVNKIRQNLLPSFIDRLALSCPKTISELTQLCKRLEESDAWSVRYKPPPSRKTGLLEPDLSYVFNDMSISRSKPMLPNSQKRMPNVSALECWNCHSPGHRYTECSIDRRVFCYGCGEANVVKTRCKKCQAKNLKVTGEVTPDNVPSTSSPENQTRNTGTKPKDKEKRNKIPHSN